VLNIFGGCNGEKIGLAAVFMSAAEYGDLRFLVGRTVFGRLSYLSQLYRPTQGRAASFDK